MLAMRMTNGPTVNFLESLMYKGNKHPIQCGQCPPLSRRATSRTPTVSPSRVFCEIARLSKMKSSLYQDDFKIPLEILWIYNP